MDNLKKRIEKLEKERQPAVPVQPPNFVARELTDEEFMELYRQTMEEEAERKRSLLQ